MTAIEYRSVCKQFPGTRAYALREVSAAIEAGEFITILGSSGCGKTTLLKMTNRLYEPDSGEILLFGENIARRDPAEPAKRAAQNPRRVGQDLSLCHPRHQRGLQAGHPGDDYE